MRAIGLSLALATAVAAPAAAQSDVARRSFTFFGSDLTIVILDHTAGQLRLVRGSAGRVEVAARAPGGFSGFGLSSADGRLRLASTGAYSVDYIVFVPDNVRVQVQTPDKAYPEPTTGGEEMTIRWSTPTEGGESGAEREQRE